MKQASIKDVWHTFTVNNGQHNSQNWSNYIYKQYKCPHCFSIHKELSMFLVLLLRWEQSCQVVPENRHSFYVHIRVHSAVFVGLYQDSHVNAVTSSQWLNMLFTKVIYMSIPSVHGVYVVSHISCMYICFSHPSTNIQTILYAKSLPDVSKLDE